MLDAEPFPTDFRAVKSFNFTAFFYLRDAYAAQNGAA